MALLATTASTSQDVIASPPQPPTPPLCTSNTSLLESEMNPLHATSAVHDAQDGSTPLFKAVGSGHTAAAELLLNRGATIDMANKVRLLPPFQFFLFYPKVTMKGPDACLAPASVTVTNGRESSRGCQIHCPSSNLAN